MIPLSRYGIVLVSLLLLLTACGAAEPEEGPASPQIVMALVDLSGSTDAARAAYLEQTEQILASVPPGARFLLLPISDRSLTAKAAVDVTFPAYTWWKTNSFTHARTMARLREEAMTAAEEALQPATGSRGTAILDGLKQAESFLADYPEGTGAIYLLSDMVEQSDLIDLYGLTTDKIAPALARLQEAERLPALRGAVVTVAGLEAASSLPPPRVRAIQSFWEQFFQSTGAQLRRYSPTLQLP